MRFIPVIRLALHPAKDKEVSMIQNPQHEPRLTLDFFFGGKNWVPLSIRYMASFNTLCKVTYQVCVVNPFVKQSNHSFVNTAVYSYSNSRFGRLQSLWSNQNLTDHRDGESSNIILYFSIRFMPFIKYRKWQFWNINYISLLMTILANSDFILQLY